MENIFERTENLIGKEALSRLKNSHVAVFGLGGVGGAAAEALVRAGVGTLSFFDGDVVSASNINRQLIATSQTVGKHKVKVAKDRAVSINPLVKVFDYPVFYTPENSKDYDMSKYDFVIDAVDMVTAKKEIIKNCYEKSVEVISSMGTGNKLDACAFEITDISKTSVCPLARVMRRELSKMGIKNLAVLYSKETPIQADAIKENRIPASISYVPNTAGFLIAGYVIRKIAGI